MRRVSDSEGVYQKEVGDGGEGALGPQAFSYSELLKYSPGSSPIVVEIPDGRGYSENSIKKAKVFCMIAAMSVVYFFLRSIC